jgi:hypothetical protein
MIPRTGLHSSICASAPTARAPSNASPYAAPIVISGSCCAQPRTLLTAEVVDIARYPSRHHLAAANGSASIPASSGRIARYRLNRGGNRRLNRALYTIAITEVRAGTEGRAYYQRKRAEGKTGRKRSAA